MIHLPIRYGQVPLLIARVHFATNHSHINYYIDLTMTKHRLSEAKEVCAQLCDRILVLCGGKVNGILDGRKTTKEEVGLRMTNLVKEEQA